MDQKRLEERILQANDAYFNGESIMSDTQYDELVKQLQEDFPKSKLLNEVGAKPNDDKKSVKLRFNLPSLNKVNEKQFEAWISKFSSTDFIISSKLDGVSAMIINRNGKMTMFTRGDGSFGTNISNLLPKITNIPKNLKDDFVLRGELIITKKDFDKYLKGKFSNSRNTVSGVVNAKKPNEEALRYTKFIAYETIEPTMKPSDQLTFSEKLGFETVKYSIHKKLQLPNTRDIYKKMRESSTIDIDGIVIHSDKIYARGKDNPKHSIAFKLKDENDIVSKRAKVLDVTWQISKHNRAKPVVLIEPTTLNNVTIRRVSGKNAKFIQENGIGKGAIILITRSGDVIPNIIGVIKPVKELNLPENGVWDKNRNEILVDGDTDEKNMNVLYAFFGKSGLNVVNMGPASISRLFKQNFNSIKMILNMKKKDFEFLGKNGEKIYESLAEIKKNDFESINPIKIMASSNCFGPGVGERKINIVFQKYKKFDVTMKELLALDGYSVKTAEIYRTGFREFEKFAKKINYKRYLTHKEVPVKKTATSGTLLYNKNILMTGKRDSYIMNIIEKHGGNLQKSFTNTLDILITDNIQSSSSKMKKAREKNIEILDHETFLEKFDK